MFIPTHMTLWGPGPFPSFRGDPLGDAPHQLVRLIVRGRRDRDHGGVVGVTSRGPFGHGGASPTLEDWLDAARLSGHGTSKPSPGHEFGLRLNPREKSDLIAFLKTL
jgi:hypothetical protein